MFVNSGRQQQNLLKVILLYSCQLTLSKSKLVYVVPDGKFETTQMPVNVSEII